MQNEKGGEEKREREEERDERNEGKNDRGREERAACAMIDPKARSS